MDSRHQHYVAAPAIAPAAFQAPCAECSDLFFTGVGGARIYAKLMRPRGLTRPGPAGRDRARGREHDEGVGVGGLAVVVGRRAVGGQRREPATVLGVAERAAQGGEAVVDERRAPRAAEQRAHKALEQAEAVRRDADEHAKSLVSNARRNADQIVSEARTHSEKMVTEARTELDRERRSMQRQVDDLIRQRDSITGHLDQLRHLLGSMPVPGLEKLADAANAAAPARPQRVDEVQTAGEIAGPSDVDVASAEKTAGAARR